MSALRPVWVVFAKDVRIELRRRESLASMAFFGALVLVILSLAVGGGRRVSPETGAGILWVAVLFAAVLGLGRVFAREKEDGCVSALLVSPLSPGALFAAKALVNFTLMAAAEVVLVPLFFVLFGRGLAGNPLPLVPVIALVNAGFFGAQVGDVDAPRARRLAAAALLLWSVATVAEATFSQALLWERTGLWAGALSPEAWALARLPLLLATALITLIVLRRARR